MEETKGGGGYEGGSASASAKTSSAFVSFGDRKRFTIELRPAETTIVSWKKLSKDANKSDRPPPVAEAPSNAHPALESRLAPPGPPAEGGADDAPPASRFSAVIEKIERLYMGKHSSDEEDLNDIPPDDEYDTEDSFIDDAELDEYFQVDNSAIKHDGFFVNRGKLERINEPASLSNEQPKKRRRKDIEKFHGEGDGAHLSNKNVKSGKKTTGNSMPSVGKCSYVSHVVALPSIHSDMMKLHSSANFSVARAKKRSVETKMFLDPSPCNILNGSSNQMEQRKIAEQKTGDFPSNYQDNRMEDGGQTSDHLLQRSHEHGKSQPGKVLNTADEMEQLLRLREKDINTKKDDPNVTEGKYPMQVVKTPPSHKKEGSSVRPKSTMLEKAIRELEKMVAESKPLTMAVPEAEVKQRRLPREVKLKLAKVARLAASNGKISNELLNRLMGILGHWIQLRTLKRNLKDMVNLGLTAKKEKDDRSQLMKAEIAELIKMRMPLIKSKFQELEQDFGACCGIKEIRHEDKEVIKRKYCMDDVLEDKICNLYDLYVDGLDEDAGPQVRKLYAELAQLWPERLMDNHGIKRAICRAKDRKRALYSRKKDQEKIKRKKLLAPKAEETVQVEGNSAGQPQCILEKSTTDPVNHHAPTSLYKLAPDATAVKEEKVKSSNINETWIIDALKKKKKVTRNPELDTGGAQNRMENSASVQGEDRQKSRKQVPVVSQKQSVPFVVADNASVPIHNPTSIAQAAAPNLNKAVDA